MHKGVICLTKATDKDDAISNVESFLEQYGNGDVWDWYVIGGRWSGLLNPKHNLFQEKAEKHFKAAYPEKEHPFLTQNMVEEQSAALDTIWAEIGGTGKHPYQRDSYANGGADDDSVPMSTCLEIINEWKTDMRAEAEKHFEKMLEAREKEKGNDSKFNTMSAYYAGLYKDCLYDNFSFESNVYDIDEGTNNIETALENPDKYYAVVVDMHN
jgi:hypothetical protein